jgi:hypothetical protein
MGPYFLFTYFMNNIQGKFKCIKCECKGDELNNVIFCQMEFFKHDSSWHRVESVRHIQLEISRECIRCHGPLLHSHLCGPQIGWGNTCLKWTSKSKCTIGER